MKDPLLQRKPVLNLTILTRTIIATTVYILMYSVLIMYRQISY